MTCEKNFFFQSSSRNFTNYIKSVIVKMISLKSKTNISDLNKISRSWQFKITFIQD